MKKLKRTFHVKAMAIVALTLLLITAGMIASFLTSRSIRENISQRAIAEVEYTAREQASLISTAIERQFDPLDILAAYLEDSDFESLENRYLTESMIRVNHWCTIGYADAQGHAVNYNGEDMGSVADRAYFSDIISGAATHKCLYLANTKAGNGPRFLFSVPVYDKDGEIRGVLFASKQVSVLEPILLENTGSDDYTDIYLVDSEGDILAANENGHAETSCDNYFDSYTADGFGDSFCLKRLKEAMAAGESGYFEYSCPEDAETTVSEGRSAASDTETDAGERLTADTHEDEYIYYMPTGVNDWYLFAAVDLEQSEAKYAESLRAIRMNVFFVTIIFYALVVIVIVYFCIHVSRMRRTEDMLRREKMRTDILLREMGCELIQYDVRQQSFTVDGGLMERYGLDMTGPLETVRSRLTSGHPEAGFEAVFDKLSEIAAEGGDAVFEIPLTLGEESCWLKLRLVPYQNRNGEITYIYGSFLDITDTQLALEESRIRGSISQMQPHFLYNALGSIREIILEDPQYASDLICDFTTHLRACVRSMTNNDLVPFEKELENVRAYVNIEKMRFGDKLRMVYEIEADDFMIVPLSIQPLVENAIRHGIYERGPAGGTVTLRSRRSGDAYTITVEDDGVGFDYEAVRAAIDRGERDSTGLTNLIFRLKHLLGGSVRVDSRPGEGTLITVTLPADRQPAKS